MLPLVPVGIDPHARLLRRDDAGHAGGNIGVGHIVRLVGGGLQGVQGQHAVIHALPAGAAVLDHQIRVLLIHLADPAVQRAVMLQHGVPGAVAVQIAAPAGGDVVVDLEVLAAVVLHQPVNHAHTIFAHFGVAEVQQIAVVFNAALAVGADEPVVRQPFRQLAGRAHDLDLQPHTHTQPLAAGIIIKGLQPTGEALGALPPLAHLVPPGACVVPACIQAVVLAAQGGGPVDDLLLLLLGGIAEEAVHVIVEHHIAALVILIGPADQAAISGQLTDGLIDAAHVHAEGCGHGGEALPGAQVLPPGAVIAGAQQAHVQVAVVRHAVLDLPRAGVLHLTEEHLAALRVAYNAHGQVLAGGPGIRAAVMVAAVALVRQAVAQRGHVGQPQIHRVGLLPLGLGGPAVVGDIELQPVIGRGGSVLPQALIDEGGRILQPDVLLRAVGQRAPGTDNRQPGIGLQAVVCRQPVGGLDRQGQQGALGVLFNTVADVAPPGGDAARVVLARMEARGALAGHMNRQELPALDGFGMDGRQLRRPLPQGDVRQLHGPVVTDAEGDVQPALADGNDHGDSSRQNEECMLTSFSAHPGFSFPLGRLPPEIARVRRPGPWCAGVRGRRTASPRPGCAERSPGSGGGTSSPPGTAPAGTSPRCPGSWRSRDGGDRPAPAPRSPAPPAAEGC